MDQRRGLGDLMEKLAENILNAVTTSNWKAAAVLVLCGLVWLVRKYAPKIHGKTGALLNSDRGGVLTVLAMGMLGAIGTALLAHKPVNVALLKTALSVAVMAAGGWTMVKRTLFPAIEVDPSKLQLPDAEKTPTTPPVALFLPFVLFFLPGCSASQWKAIGVDVGKCVAPAVLNGAADAIVDILNQSQAGDVSADAYKQIGIKVASTYGVNAAVCAVGKLVQDLGLNSATASHGQQSKPAMAVAWLAAHKAEWAK